MIANSAEEIVKAFAAKQNASKLDLKSKLQKIRKEYATKKHC